MTEKRRPRMVHLKACEILQGDLWALRKAIVARDPYSELAARVRFMEEKINAALKEPKA